MDFLKFMYNGYFPRKFSRPEQTLVNSHEELVQMINLYHRSCRCGCSIYDWDGTDKPVTLDRLVFDIDHKDALEDVKKLHKEFRAVQHFIVHSGGGFHFYLFTENYQRFKTQPEQLAAVRAAYADIEKKLGVKNDPSLDQNAVRHMLAIPGTWNSKPGRFRYVIFVSEEDLEKGMEHIHKLAEKPPETMPVYGMEYFDIGRYAGGGGGARAAAEVEIGPAREKPRDWDIWLGWQPLFIQNMLTRPDKTNFKSRYYVAVWCAQKAGLSLPDALNMAEYFFGQMKHETGCSVWERVLLKNPFTDVYKDPKKHHFPSINTLQEQGYL